MLPWLLLGHHTQCQQIPAATATLLYNTPKRQCEYIYNIWYIRILMILRARVLLHGWYMSYRRYYCFIYYLSFSDFIIAQRIKLRHGSLPLRGNTSRYYYFTTQYRLRYIFDGQRHGAYWDYALILLLIFDVITMIFAYAIYDYFTLWLRAMRWYTYLYTLFSLSNCIYYFSRQGFLFAVIKIPHKWQKKQITFPHTTYIQLWEISHQW